MRLIDADALILALETQDYSGSPETLEDWTPQDVTKAEIADINNAPTIDAEPVIHGRWIRHREPPMYLFECSVCGQKYFNPVAQSQGNYCSNCGCKMDLDEVEE